MKPYIETISSFLRTEEEINQYYMKTLQESYEDPTTYIAFLNDLIYHLDV